MPSPLVRAGLSTCQLSVVALPLLYTTFVLLGSPMLPDASPLPIAVCIEGSAGGPYVWVELCEV